MDGGEPDLPSHHFVDVHVVNVAFKSAFCYLGGFGCRVGHDFVGLHLVVEILYIDLIHTEAVGAVATGFAIVVFVGCGSEK